MLDVSRSDAPLPDEPSAVVRSCNEPPPDALTIPMELRIGGVVLDTAALLSSRLLGYVRMLAQLVDGIDLSRDSLIDLLRRAMRQHSIANRRRVDYVLGFLQRHPP
jgi:hypothetical protein